MKFPYDSKRNMTLSSKSLYQDTPAQVPNALAVLKWIYNLVNETWEDNRFWVLVVANNFFYVCLVHLLSWIMAPRCTAHVFRLYLLYRMCELYQSCVSEYNRGRIEKPSTEAKSILTDLKDWGLYRYEDLVDEVCGSGRNELVLGATPVHHESYFFPQNCFGEIVQWSRRGGGRGSAKFYVEFSRSRIPRLTWGSCSGRNRIVYCYWRILNGRARRLGSGQDGSSMCT